MKTPRLALLAIALPALLLAPYAKAGPAPKAPAASALPTWSVVDEGFRAWTTVYFSVGKDRRALKCRYSECNPDTNKGQSNLYVLVEGTRVPIDATIFEYHELGRWDPRRLTGQTQTKTSKVVKAHRQNYSSQLSNFKLDNTGGVLTVVQGGIKYPATTDIRTVYVSESGSVVAVAPPTKKANDVVKPDAPVTPRPPTGGNPPAAPQFRWCETATGNVRLAAKSPGAGWSKLESETSVCNKPDGTRPVPPPDAPTVLELSTKEKLWLTKRQKADYEEALKAAPVAGPERASAMKDLVERTRKTVADNLVPNSAAVTAYNAAAAEKEPTIAKIDGALPAEVWGGPNSAIVGLSGERLDIQLSKEEWAVLSASPTLVAALKAYKDGRKGADGNAGASAVGEGTYSADAYDPIQLHLVTMAARTAVGPVVKPPVTTPPGGAKVPPLTQDELDLLTKEERAIYDDLLKKAESKKPEDEERLAKETERLRNLIVSEGRKKPYVAPTEAQVKDPAQWAKIPDSVKDIFCNPQTMGGAAAAADSATPGVDNSRDPRRGLENSAAAAGATTGGTTTAGGGLPDWAKGPCAMYLAGKTPVSNPNPNRGSSSSVPPLGDDSDLASRAKEVPDTVANSWFMRTQLQTALQGGLIGLVIGSLFGPIGLIAGPLIGGALLYGMQKYDAVKAEKAKNKEKSAGE